MTRIHNIGHIHNANFVQTQFSTSHPKKWHFLKKRKFTFLWKYSVCGFKFEISEYPIKPPYVSYSPYKYELKRIKTHEIRAKYFLGFLFRPRYWIRFYHSAEDILITRERHRQNLQNCVDHLEKFKQKRKIQDFDMAAEDLRLATRHLGMIVGKVDVEELLGSIFNDFCIGK